MANIPVYSALPQAARAAGARMAPPDMDVVEAEGAMGFTIPQTTTEAESYGFLGHTGDIAAAPFRGIAGGIEGLLEIPSDFIGLFTESGQIYDIPDNLGLGRSKTLIGGLTEGVSQFLIPTKLAAMTTKGLKIGKLGLKGVKVKYLGKYKKSSALIATEKMLIKTVGRKKG